MLKHNFLIAMINNMDHIKDPYILSICQNMLFYNMKEFGWESTTKVFRDPVTALNFAADNNYEHLIISYPGNDLEKHNRLNRAMDEFITTDDFIVGHLLDRGDNYYELHEQLIYINSFKWKDLGRPQPGNWGDSCTYKTPVRSTENHHDDYTPYWIKPGTEYKTYTNCRSFHNIINAGLEAGYTIRSFDKSIRNSKTYIYPEDENCKRNIQELLDKEFSPRFYTKNTEKFPIDFIKSKIDKFDKLVTVAAGLNHLKLLYSVGYDKNTVLEFIDSEQFAIDSMMFLYKRWNGYNYTKFCTFLADGESTGRLTVYPDKKWWDEFTSYFGGEDEFSKFFIDLKNTITVKFNTVNILETENNEVLKNLLYTDSPESTLYWFSNIFHYKPTSYIHSKSTIAKSQDSLIDLLPKNALVFMDNVLLEGDKIFTVNDYTPMYEKTIKYENLCLGK